MTYALNAKITLPPNIGGACIAEINIGRYTTLAGAVEGRNEFMLRPEVTTFDKILAILEEDLGMTLCVHPVIVDER